MQIQDTSKQDTIIKRNPIKRILLTVVAIIGITILAGVLFHLFGHLFQAETSISRKNLRLATVEKGTLIHELSVEGRLIATSYPTIYSVARGRILLKVKAGDTVQKGTLLAIQESPEWENQLLQELSLLTVYETELDRKILEMQTRGLINQQDVELKKLKHVAAIRELERAEASYKQGLINQIEFEKDGDSAQIASLELSHAIKKQDLEQNIFQLDIQNQKKKIEQQMYRADEAQRKVNSLRIVSPLNGVVGSIEVNPEDILIPNQAILSIIDLSAFEIQVFIPENMSDDIQVGLTAAIKSEGVIYQGRLTSISPEVHNSQVEGRVVFVQSYPENLKQKQRVAVNIILAQKNDVIKVKRGPFLESGHSRIAYIVRNNLAEQRNIQTGIVSLTEVEITSGLEAEDTIIISDISRFDDKKIIYLRN